MDYSYMNPALGYGGYGAYSGFWFFSQIAIFLACLALSGGSMIYLKTVMARNANVMVGNGLTGEQAAERILRWAGITDVTVECGDSFLGDHYNPADKTLVLSPDNFNGCSAVNVGVAAHECGHALQHQQRYAPLQWRMSSVYATNFANTVVNSGLIFLAVFTHLLSLHVAFGVLAAAWGVVMLFNLVTLPVEFDASARAKRVLLQLGMVQPGAEDRAVRETLNAAGLTYVAAFLTSLLYFAYYYFRGTQSRND